MKLVEFYRGEIPNGNGIYIDDILSYTYHQLEGDHEYIQWILPKREASMFHPDIPVLDQRQIVLFNSDHQLKGKVGEVLHKMLDFYGMRLEDGLVRWQESDPENGHKNPKWWLDHFNHNFLRITRMLISLRHLGFANEAIAIYKLLKTERDKYDDVTHEYWEDAAYGPLP